MRTRARVLGGVIILVCGAGPAGAGEGKVSYPAMAPFGQYGLANGVDEVALARSAAPASIAGDAEVLTFGSRGYETAAKGKNGFVCLVQRSWAAGFDDQEFWNPKLRGPICFNPAAVRTVLPGYLERTGWVLAGASKSEMIARTKAQLAANTYVVPESGSMAYMLSKQQVVSDAAGHWHPHLMFFVAHTDGAAWGANLKGSPIFAAQGGPEPITTFFIPVARWSDGTPSAMH
jgi:hypothetical protein